MADGLPQGIVFDGSLRNTPLHHHVKVVDMARAAMAKSKKLFFIKRFDD
jgi:hypothetical protein